MFEKWPTTLPDTHTQQNPCQKRLAWHPHPKNPKYPARHAQKNKQKGV